MIRSDIGKRVIWAYGEIESGADFSAKNIIEHLSILGPGDVTLRINSDGGAVPEGWAIYGALNRHDGKITTINDSICASMATVVFMVGEERLATPYAQFMIHSPHTAAAGNKADLRKSADTLEQFEKTLHSAYSQVLNCSDDELTEMLEQETWLDAASAVEIGLATGIEEATEEVEHAVKASGLSPFLLSKAELENQRSSRILAKIRNHKKRTFQVLARLAMAERKTRLQSRFGNRNTEIRFESDNIPSKSSQPVTAQSTDRSEATKRHQDKVKFQLWQLKREEERQAKEAKDNFRQELAAEKRYELKLEQAKEKIRREEGKASADLNALIETNRYLARHGYRTEPIETSREAERWKQTHNISDKAFQEMLAKRR